MTAPGPAPNANNRIEQEIARIWQVLNEQARKTLYSAAISGGKLTVQDGAEFSVLHDIGGGWLLHVGKGTLGKYFLTIRRDDGTVAFEIGTTGSGFQYWAGWDRAGHIVVGDDAVSGSGLARPWLPQATIPVLSTSIPTTSSATYIATTSTAQMPKQQPYAELEALLLSTGGGVGNARFTMNGSQVGTVMPIASGAFAWQTIQTLPLPGDYDGRVTIDLQVQRTNASGAVGGVFRCTQRQSP